mgnify:CR=1 FL=1
MISHREKFLMREAMKAAAFYSDLDEWLHVEVSDAGHVVEQSLNHDADLFSRTEMEREAVELAEIIPRINNDIER